MYNHKILEGIIEDKTLNITQKIEKINKAEENFRELCECKRKTLLKDYKYCPYCKLYYKVKAWDVEPISKVEKRYVDNSYEDHCSLTSTASFYKDVQIAYNRYICPTGHIIEEEVKDGV